MSEFRKFREDLRVFSEKHSGQGVLKYIYYPDLRAVFIYRLSRWFFLHRLKLLAYLCVLLNDFLHGVWIGPAVEAGQGLFLGHPRGLMVNPGTKIGAYCTLLSQVTLGGPSNIVGDFVELGAGAKIISKHGREVLVGAHSMVGAGAVVTRSCAPYTILAGVPAKEIGKKDLGQWLERHRYYRSVVDEFGGTKLM